MILLDIEKCYECGECGAQCSYPLHHGKTSCVTLIETAIRKITCRHCEDAPCVISCPTKALEKQDDGLTRAGMLCTSCKTCLIACPFGVNTLETVNFEKAPCDLCEGREILCVKTCPKGAVSSGQFKENDAEGVYKIADGIFAKGVHWKKQLGIKEGTKPQ
ncbi:ferredoxin [bacterium]|nr:ferredoxin [bacterium]MBU3954957.1 ferredoxin [bacterium]